MRKHVREKPPLSSPARPKKELGLRFGRTRSAACIPTARCKPLHELTKHTNRVERTIGNGVVCHYPMFGTVKKCWSLSSPHCAFFCSRSHCQSVSAVPKKKKTKTTKPEKKNKLKLSFGVGGGERFPNGGLWAEEIMYEWRATKTFVQSKVECIISSVRQYNFFCFCFCVSPFSTTISAFISSRLQVRKKAWGTSFPPLVSSKA